MLAAGLVVLGTGASLSLSRPATALAALQDPPPMVGPGVDDGLPGFHGTAARYEATRSFGVRTGQRASRGVRRTPLAPQWVRPGTGVLTSCFCWRWGSFHKGIDLAAPFGAPIYAAGPGVVVQAGPASGYGNLVVIRHDARTFTAYGHEEATLVTVGQRVHAGQIIALVGSMGNSTGPHLHFEVRNSADGGQTNPIPWLRRRGIRV